VAKSEREHTETADDSVGSCLKEAAQVGSRERGGKSLRLLRPVVRPENEKQTSEGQEKG
jgi:hypothetical protein